MIKTILVFLSILFFLTGCSNDKKSPTPKQEKVKEKHHEDNISKPRIDLEEENRLLKEEIYSLKKGKKEVFESMFAAMVAKDENLVLKKAGEIEKLYPETKEALIANKFKSRILNKYKNRLQETLKYINKKDNEKLKAVWYYDKKSKLKMSDSPIFLYISKRYNGIATLRMRIQTTKKEAKQINGFVLLSDRSSYDIIPPKIDIKQKELGAGTWVWYDKELSEKEIEMVKDLIYSKKSMVRFINGNSYSQKPLSVSDKKIFIRVMRAYYSMLKFDRYN